MMTTDSERNESGADRLRPLLLFLGFALLGVALALLLFGDDLLGDAAPAGNEANASVLEQAGELEAPSVTAIAGVNPGGQPQVGDQASGFVLDDLEGNAVSLADFRGRPVIVNFWATWCAPCVVEMPALQEAYEAHQDEGLVILALNREEDLQTIAAFLDNQLETTLTFTILRDETAAVAGRYKVFNMPSTYFIDPAGAITAFHRGPLTRGQIDEFLAQTLQG